MVCGTIRIAMTTRPYSVWQFLLRVTFAIILLCTLIDTRAIVRGHYTLEAEEISRHKGGVRRRGDCHRLISLSSLSRHQDTTLCLHH